MPVIPTNSQANNGGAYASKNIFSQAVAAGDLALLRSGAGIDGFLYLPPTTVESLGWHLHGALVPLAGKTSGEIELTVYLGDTEVVSNYLGVILKMSDGSYMDLTSHPLNYYNQEFEQATQLTDTTAPVMTGGERTAYNHQMGRVLWSLSGSPQTIRIGIGQFTTARMFYDRLLGAGVAVSAIGVGSLKYSDGVTTQDSGFIHVKRWL